MNKKISVLTPVLIIIACTLPATFGLDIVSVMLISAYLTSLFTQKSLKCYILYSLLSAVAFFTALAGNLELFLIYFSLTLITSLVLGICIKKKRSLAYCITAASLCTILVFAAIIFFGMKKYTVSATWLIFGNYINALKSALVNAQEISEAVTSILVNMEKQLDLLLPSMIVIAAGFFSYFTFGIARAFLSKSGIKLNMRHFYELRLTSSFTFIFVIVDLISLFMGSNVFFANVSIVLSTLFVMCGISLIDFYLELRGLIMPLRIGIYVVGFILTSFTGVMGSLLISVLQLVGLIDSIRPLRRISTDRF